MARSAFAVVAPGLESIAEGELRALGIANTAVEPGGIGFAATDEILAAALIQLRTVTRVLVRAVEFRATSFAQLERHARTVPWSEWISPGARVRFRVTCKKSRLYHSDAVAERLERAVTEAVKGVSIANAEPPASKVAASDDDARDDDARDDDAQLFVVRMAHDVCTISADAAGVALHKRGYRQAVAKAPLRETLAAAMLIGAGWDSTTAVYDPLCGSGTIVIEAAMMARRIAPGLRRKFAAERWPTMKTSVWSAVRAKAESIVLSAPNARLAGSDRDTGAITAARANAERAGVANDVDFRVAAVGAARAAENAGLLIANPPYGIRVGETTALRDLYAQFGRVAREQFAGWRCAVLSADRARGHPLERQMALPLEPAWVSRNGGIPVRLLAGTIPR